MTLTDLERQEFHALAEATYDPELWTEDDLAILRATKKNFEAQDDEIQPDSDDDNEGDEPI